MNLNMEIIEGYEIPRQKLKETFKVRMSNTMISELRNIRKITGIPVSEIIRESVRKTLIEVDETGSLNIKVK